MDHVRALALAVLEMLEKDRNCEKQPVPFNGGFGLTQGQCTVGMEKRMPEVSIKTDRLFLFSGHLSARIAELEGRLSPVLRSVPAMAGKAESSIAASLLGGQLGEIELRIELMIAAVDSIADRLEV